jgi:16S rRNA (adenine1518-N6/adenine1519-N6)-dimethyltransferase
VIGIEIDPLLARHLRATFGNNPAFELVERDVLQVAVDELIALQETYQVVANLPYNVASAVIRHFLEQDHRPRRLTVMVQKEVALRMLADPPDMTVLSVAVQLYATPRLALTVPPSVFIPSPKVESAVVNLDARPRPLLSRERQRPFFLIVNAGFRHKRKTVANSLAMELNRPKADIELWLEDAEIDPQRRAQTLSIEEWIHLLHDMPDGWNV